MNPTPQPQPRPTSWWKRQSAFVKAVVVALPLVVIINMVKSTMPTTTQPATAVIPSAPVETEAPRPTGISLAQYGELQTGSSYRQAVALLGAEGTEMSSNDLGGTHTVMYQWKAGSMANMNAIFQNDKLVSKAQFGLK